MSVVPSKHESSDAVTCWPGPGSWGSLLASPWNHSNSGSPWASPGTAKAITPAAASAPPTPPAINLFMPPAPRVPSMVVSAPTDASPLPRVDPPGRFPLRAFDRHRCRMGCERLEVLGVAREHGPAGLGCRDGHGVDRGAVARPVAELGGTLGQGLRQRLGDVTRLDEPVRSGVPPTPPGQ